jgi:hypothetical protein
MTRFSTNHNTAFAQLSYGLGCSLVRTNATLILSLLLVVVDPRAPFFTLLTALVFVISSYRGNAQEEN